MAECAALLFLLGKTIHDFTRNSGQVVFVVGRVEPHCKVDNQIKGEPAKNALQYHIVLR